MMTITSWFSAAYAFLCATFAWLCIKTLPGKGGLRCRSYLLGIKKEISAVPSYDAFIAERKQKSLDMEAIVAKRRDIARKASTGTSIFIFVVSTISALLLGINGIVVPVMGWPIPIIVHFMLIDGMMGCGPRCKVATFDRETRDIEFVRRVLEARDA